MLLLAAPSARHSRSSTEGQFHPLVKSARGTAFHLNQETLLLERAVAQQVAHPP